MDWISLLHVLPHQYTSSWAITCAGTTVYSSRHRAEWLAKIAESGVRVRAERLYQQLDILQLVRLQARRELLTESHKHSAVKLLCQIPSIGPIRSALLVALLQTPHRLRIKRQPWAYSGFVVQSHEAASTVPCEANFNATGSA